MDVKLEKGLVRIGNFSEKAIREEKKRIWDEACIETLEVVIEALRKSGIEIPETPLETAYAKSRLPTAIKTKPRKKS